MPNNEFADIDSNVKDAYWYWHDLMDKLSGGAFTRGYREPSASERISEWDSLTPEMIARLRDVKGAAWVAQQGAEIERLRRKLPNQVSS